MRFLDYKDINYHLIFCLSNYKFKKRVQDLPELFLKNLIL